MSSTENTPTAPRRSGRERRKPTAIIAGQQARKRKRSDVEDNEDPSSGDENEGNEEDGEDYDGPRKPTAKPKGKSTQAAKKPRIAKPKGATGKSRMPKEALDVEKHVKDANILDDNALFNAILNPATALQSTAEDFLDSLTETEGPALAELINCILRACGCNSSVDLDEVMDSDGVVDYLDTFSDGMKETATGQYPLISKQPVFKKFRNSLAEFIHRLIAASADLATLYSSELLSILQVWVTAMCSSQLRSFRHTATVVALECESALCEVAAVVEKEAVVIGKQRETEKKKKGNAARQKELQTKAEAVNEKRTKLKEFLEDFFTGVFVHRYRDRDPAIRTECVHALGIWLKKHPTHFLESRYLQYVSSVLSDSDAHARQEAVKAIAALYAKQDYIVSLHHFTERTKPRLIEIATSDVDLPIRVSVISVLQSIDSHGLLEEDQREGLCLLIYDREPKVRKAASKFVRSLWEEAVEQKMVGRKKATEKDRQMAGVKCLALLLIKFAKVLDGNESSEPAGGDEEPDGSVLAKELAVRINADERGRIAFAIEALWDEVDAAREWETLLELLLLDHSAGADPSAAGVSTTSRRKKPARLRAEDSIVDEVWRLEELEEAVLLEVLIATLRKAQAEVDAKKADHDSLQVNMTRVLIKGLPRLFAKHQTDETRISDILLIIQLMNLDMFLEMRVISAYETLWDDVTKQFLSHASPIVLDHCVYAIRHLIHATSLSNTNTTKILELEDELASSLRDAVAGKDDVEVAAFSEDEVRVLAAIMARYLFLTEIRDMSAWMEENDGGKRSSSWDIINALSERGRLGYKEEELMIERALNVLVTQVSWKAVRLQGGEDLSAEDLQYREQVKEQRDSVQDKLIEICIGNKSKPSDGVRRAAFEQLVRLQIPFCHLASLSQDGAERPTAALRHSLEDEVQYRLAGYIESMVERCAEEHDERDQEQEESEHSDADKSDREDDEGGKMNKKKKTAGEGKPRNKSPVPLEVDIQKMYTFHSLIGAFVGGVRSSIIHFTHSTAVLKHYGRLGPTFDTFCKQLVDELRTQGISHGAGAEVTTEIKNAVRKAFELYIDGIVDSEDYAVALAKTLSSTFIIRGAQLAIVKRLDSQLVVDIHLDSVSWVVKRISQYENNQNTAARNKVIAFFRVLTPLVFAIEPRDALRIKAHLDQAIAEAKIETPATSKPWEPLRAYERRLTAALSKDKTLAPPKVPKAKKAPKKTGKSAAFVSDDDGVGLSDHVQTSPKPRRPTRAKKGGVTTASEGNSSQAEDEPPPPPKRSTRTRKPTRLNGATTTEGEVEGEEDEDVPSPPRRKKPRPKPKPTRRKPSPQPELSENDSQIEDFGPTQTDDIEHPEGEQERPVANGDVSPKGSRKRPREDEEEEDPELSDAPSEPVDARSPSQASHVSVADFKSRRKKARR